MRRAYEYDHHYGLALSSKPGPPVRGRRFPVEVHGGVPQPARTGRGVHATTTTRPHIADGFPVLNALKETHLLLTEGAHNQYGDLPWTARHEMLMYEWILSRPEVRDFLPTRTMVAYAEPWMAPVDAMNKLQGWSDISVMHFRDLAVFGEQLLLGIRFGAWIEGERPGAGGELGPLLAAGAAGLHPRLPGGHRHRPDPPPAYQPARSRRGRAPTADRPRPATPGASPARSRRREPRRDVRRGRRDLLEPGALRQAAADALLELVDRTSRPPGCSGAGRSSSGMSPTVTKPAPR